MACDVATLILAAQMLIDMPTGSQSLDWGASVAGAEYAERT
jgi:hypothetical protein